jgi:hypothetical protein
VAAWTRDGRVVDHAGRLPRRRHVEEEAGEDAPSSPGLDYLVDLGATADDERLAQMEISRVKAISSARAWAALTDRAPAILLTLMVASLLGSVVVVGVSAVVKLTGQGPHDLASLFGDNSAWTQLLTAGQALTALVATGAIGLAYNAFRNRETRRRIAVLWDVVTFWPRASHPLGPPCYGERAVPDLWLRTTILTEQSNDVVIAAHSQGSVIAAAAMLMNADAENPHSLKADERPLLSGPVALLTFGCVLRRLYARNFPAYFGFQTLKLLSKKAAADATPPERWINLWAKTDPLGGWVFVEDLSPPAATMPVGPLIDRRLVDAQGIGPFNGGYPPVCGHSGFWTRPEYDDALIALQGRIPPQAEPEPEMSLGTGLAFQNLSAQVNLDTRPLIPYRLPGPSE